MSSSKTHSQVCQSVEDLLARRLLGDLNSAEKADLNRHLQNCSACQKVAVLLEKMPGTLQADAEQLAPHAETLPLIRAKLNQKKGGQFKNIPGFLSNVLQFRVPIYQAALGIALLLLLFIFISRPSIPADARMNRNLVPVQLADTTLKPDSLQKSGQTVGRNIFEDSLLAKFLYTIM